MPTSGTFFIEISGVFWQGKVLGIMNAMTKFNIGIYFYFCGQNGWANRWASVTTHKDIIIYIREWRTM